MSLQPGFFSSSELNTLPDEGFLELSALSIFGFRIRHSRGGGDPYRGIGFPPPRE